jgi:type I restriction enzyme S subunit
MDAQTFLDNFATIAEAPGGIERLRALILDLAVRGRLVPQTPQATGSSGRSADRSAGWPSSWDVLPLGQVARLRRGFDLPKSERKPGPVKVYGANGQVDSHDTVAVEGPGVVTGRSGTIGQVHLISESFWPLNTALYVEDFFGNDPGFVALLLKALNLQRFSSFSAVPTLNRNKVHKEHVGVPPLEEQKRILAKVDELMALCDELEAAQQQREQTATLARTSAIHALITAETDADRAAAWSRFADEWLSLTESPEGSARLRRVILQLGVAGHLVQQRTEDEPADKAVRRAIAELSQLPPVRGRKASGARLDGDVALFVGKPSVSALREGWRVTALSDVTRLESGHTPDRKIPHYWDGPHPWMSISDARAHRGGSIRRTAATVSDAGISNSATRLLPEGTVCLSRTASVGYSVVTEAPICTSQDFVNFICTTAIKPRYLQLIFLAEEHALKRFSKGAVHQTIYFPEVKAFHVLLPPPAEQDRIVAKVDELLRLCEDLERAQRESQNTASHLAEVLGRGLHVA